MKETPHTPMRKMKKRRKELRITAAELGSMINVSQQMIYFIEGGQRKPTAQRLQQIAKCLRTTMEELMEEE